MRSAEAIVAPSLEAESCHPSLPFAHTSAKLKKTLNLKEFLLESVLTEGNVHWGGLNKSLTEERDYVAV